MDKNDKKQLDACLAQLREIESFLNGLHTDEEADYENMSERQQNGAKGQTLGTVVSLLGEASGSVTDAAEAVNSALNELS